MSLKGINNGNLKYYIYASKTCIFESIYNENFGKINNVSQTCKHILGYEK